MGNERGARRVRSSQTGIHPRLDEVVARSLRHRHRAPVPEHQVRAWSELRERIVAHDGPWVLDAGCGTGESTVSLARDRPDTLVVGVDKSTERLSRRPAPTGQGLVVWARMDLVWLWRLAVADEVRPVAQFVLYPNPWPKPGHLQRRWHGHAVFRELLELGGHLELRTNWRVYADELRRALVIAGRAPSATELLSTPRDGAAISAFERKYADSGHDLWRVRCPL